MPVTVILTFTRLHKGRRIPTSMGFPTIGAALAWLAEQPANTIANDKRLLSR